MYCFIRVCNMYCIVLQGCSWWFEIKLNYHPAVICVVSMSPQPIRTNSQRWHCSCASLLWSHDSDGWRTFQSHRWWSCCHPCVLSIAPGGRFNNAYELLNLRALKISMLYKSHIFQCMGKIFWVEFQRVPLKFHTKYLTHTLKDESLKF